MARIVVTETADRDVDEIVTYLAEQAGARVAEKYLDLFDGVYARLALLPGSGPPRPHLGQLTRISVVSPYVVIYDWDAANDCVTVLRVVHGRRRITRRLVRQ